MAGWCRALLADFRSLLDIGPVVELPPGGTARPSFPLNRIIRQGESTCGICGSGKSTHDTSERGHAFTRHP